MTIQRQRLGPRVGWQWGLATIAGFGVGTPLGLGMGFLALPLVDRFFVGSGFLCGRGQGALACIVGGVWLIGAGTASAVVGIAQWLVLRRVIQRAGWWRLATVGGWIGVVGTVKWLTDTIFSYTDLVRGVEGTFYPVYRSTLLNTLPVLVTATGLVIAAGALLGVLQWLVLRAKLRRTGLWVLLHVLMLAVAAVLMVLLRVRGLGVEIFFAGVIFYATITGGAMAWLLAQSISRNQP